MAPAYVPCSSLKVGFSQEFSTCTGGQDIAQVLGSCPGQSITKIQADLPPCFIFKENAFPPTIDCFQVAGLVVAVVEVLLCFLAVYGLCRNFHLFGSSYFFWFIVGLPLPVLLLHLSQFRYCLRRNHPPGYRPPPLRHLPREAPVAHPASQCPSSRPPPSASNPPSRSSSSSSS